MNEHAFYKLDARQLMSTEPVTVTEKMSLRSAAHLLSQSHVSGVPVVNGTGRVVGVLSSSDFMSFVGGRPRPEPCGVSTAVCSDWQMFDVDEVPSEEEVGRHMTRDPVTVAPTTPITELARLMLDAHIHRVIVVDEDQKPLGVVSSTDILAAVARAERRRTGGA
ncbi:MAG: HPP family protein [Gemmataceae bacterium]